MEMVRISFVKDLNPYLVYIITEVKGEISCSEILSEVLF